VRFLSFLCFELHCLVGYITLKRQILLINFSLYFLCFPLVRLLLGPNGDSFFDVKLLLTPVLLGGTFFAFNIQMGLYMNPHFRTPAEQDENRKATTTTFYLSSVVVPPSPSQAGFDEEVCCSDRGDRLYCSGEHLYRFLNPMAKKRTDKVLSSLRNLSSSSKKFQTVA